MNFVVLDDAQREGLKAVMREIRAAEASRDGVVRAIFRRCGVPIERLGEATLTILDLERGVVQVGVRQQAPGDRAAGILSDPLAGLAERFEAPSLPQKVNPEDPKRVSDPAAAVQEPADTEDRFVDHLRARMASLTEFLREKVDRARAEGRLPPHLDPDIVLGPRFSADPQNGPPSEKSFRKEVSGPSDCPSEMPTDDDFDGADGPDGACRPSRCRAPVNAKESAEP